MRLIYFSPVNWNSYRQRPHYMVEYLLANGVSDAIWIDPYPTRLPSLADLHRPTAKGASSETPRDRRVRVLKPRAMPIEPIPASGVLNRLAFWRGLIAELVESSANQAAVLIGIGRPSKLALAALDRVPHIASFYDAMDDFPAFYEGLSARSMTRVEAVIAKRVHRVFASAPSLIDKFDRIGVRAELVANAYEMAKLPLPATESLRSGIGYIGTIGRWFDWPLVTEIARALPSERVRLVGPEFVPRPDNLPANVAILPECTQQEAVRHVATFEVGLIPFLVNPLTASVDPIKYYEYLSLGVPVWSTAFGPMALRENEPHVSLVRSGASWGQLLRAVRERPIARRQTERFRSANDWSARFALLRTSLPLGTQRPETSAR